MTRVYYVPNFQTHHVLRWLSLHAVDEIDPMIAAAIDRARAGYRFSDFERYDLYTLVAEQLASLLAQWFSQRADELTGGDSDANCDCPRLGLLAPLLDSAIAEIDFLSMADALLRMTGKLAPAGPTYRNDNELE